MPDQNILSALMNRPAAPAGRVPLPPRDLSKPLTTLDKILLGITGAFGIDPTRPEDAASNQWNALGELAGMAMAPLKLSSAMKSIGFGEAPETLGLVNNLTNKPLQLTAGAEMKGAAPVAASMVAKKFPRAPITDLPLDEASRMARAQDMGFTIDAYHGTSVPTLGGFNLQSRGAASSADDAHKGFFFTDSPAVAEAAGDATVTLPKGRVADKLNTVFKQRNPDAVAGPNRWTYRELESEAADKYVNTLPEFKGRIDRIKQLQEEQLKAELHGDHAKADSYYAQIDSLIRQHYDAKQRYLDENYPSMPRFLTNNYNSQVVYPVKLRMDNPYKADFAGKQYTQDSFSHLIEDALKGGHDGAIVHNVQDYTSQPATQYIVFQPNQIRSRWANFDPRQIKSGNLLAGGAITAALMNKQQE